MKQIFEQAVSCGDIGTARNVIRIMAESCEYGLSDASLLKAMKEVSSEIGTPHYDEDMAKLHLRIIGEVQQLEPALLNFHSVEEKEIGAWDFVVLWAEMVKMHGAKIRKWFAPISEFGFEEKILDECEAFLNSGLSPFFEFDI